MITSGHHIQIFIYDTSCHLINIFLLYLWSPYTYIRFGFGHLTHIDFISPAKDYGCLWSPYTEIDLGYLLLPYTDSGLSYLWPLYTDIGFGYLWSTYAQIVSSYLWSPYTYINKFRLHLVNS